LVEVNKWMASIQVHSGSFVAWKIVPLTRVVWCRQARHW
jgi:hypothetical protein